MMCLHYASVIFALAFQYVPIFIRHLLIYFFLFIFRSDNILLHASLGRKYGFFISLVCQKLDVKLFLNI